MGKPPQGDEAFDSLIRRAWEAGRRKWPEVDLPTEIFSRHLAGLLTQAPEDEPLAVRIEQLDLEGLYLACACVSGVPGASELFEHHYMARLPALLGYLKLSHTMLDEVCQQLRMHLLLSTPEAPPRLASYTGRGALLSWMKVIAVRMAIRQGASVRAVSEEVGLAAMEELPALETDPELSLVKSRYRHEFRQAVRAAFSALPDEQRYLLRLHFLEGLPTTRMGPLFGKDQSTISRWLKDVRQRVYEDTKRRLQETLRLSSQEFESFMTAVQSRFDVSLSQILGQEEGGEAGH